VVGKNDKQIILKGGLMLIGTMVFKVKNDLKQTKTG